MADSISPGKAQYPDHEVSILPANQHLRVWHGDTLIADTKKALLVKETAHDDVYYFPLSDIEMKLFEQTSHESYCPFKGDAVYWSLKAGDEHLDNVLWSYPTPFDDVQQLREYGAFYADRVTITVDDNQ